MKKKLFLGVSLSLCLVLTSCGSSSSVGAIQSSVPAKPITVTDQEMTLSLKLWDDSGLSSSVQERTGTYSGETVNGVPEGHGTFKTTNPAGNPWYYEGEFTNGAFNGQGKSIWPVDENSDEDELSEIGTYTDGLFTPTKSELIQHLGTFRWLGEFSISDETKSFIDSHENLFPTQNDSDLQDLESFVDRTIQYKHLTKSLSKYLSNIVEISNVSVVQIFETPIAGHTITSMLVQDQDFNSIVIYFDRPLEVYQGDSVSIFGLPVASTGFDNVGGGTTNVIVLYGCSIF